MISLGSLDEVVFMLHVNLKDLGLTSVPSFTALLTDLFPEDWGTGLDCPPPPVPSNGLLENFEDNFEKKVDGLEELSADVSCEDVGIPGAYGFRVRFRVIPEWKVDRSGTFRENDCAFAEDPRPDGDKGVLSASELSNWFVLSVEVEIFPS
jgi:hypothetical protein